MKDHKPHIVSYSTYFLILVTLLVLTGLTILITSYELGPFNATAAMLIAGLKGFLVLAYFMHLKFESAFYRIMVAGVIILFLLVAILTFFDYSYRV